MGLEPSTHHVAGDAAACEDGAIIWPPTAGPQLQTVFRFTRGETAGAG